MGIAGVFLAFAAGTYVIELIFPHMGGYCQTLEGFYLIFAVVALVLGITRRTPDATLPPPAGK
ncbi:hypothetical protein K6L44_01315 [Gluconacetobacter entanii]|uniref:Uncharacterized protein n=1 Tax=Gluconacetobacter entanii TaxID=108528 RepID=A0A318PZN4_9PROT|nr:hypothetical protein [Gluconacetobacter entanii]MBE7618572.1 hypothetical protein [Komagataeibacter sp. FXV2]MCE2577037.1 hypothetical protein [Komagataeibacter sp. FNDCR1]MBY4638659.1 hypothetical protein [Gluconacetobacter entanii]MCW4579325.1 hypothetical protein [Gluconacetobacter entanii]MCW4582715.1 hypothetical protein [Gluconacetobacter entanii]